MVTRYDPEERKALQNYLPKKIEMKDLGELKYFHEFDEMSQSNTGIFLSQRKYDLDQLQETSMLAWQPTETPVEEGTKLCAFSPTKYLLIREDIKDL